MLDGEARLIAARWLAEARIARDTARFALPPSTSGAWALGDVVELASDTDAGAALWRIDRAVLSGPREIEATRVEPGPLRPRRNRSTTTPPAMGAYRARPGATGGSGPAADPRRRRSTHAPWLAVSARAWPGAVALHHRAPAPTGFVLEALIARPRRLGVTESALDAAAPPDVGINGPALVQVRMLRGALHSVSPAGRCAGRGEPAGHRRLARTWEVLQFADAELIAPDTYALRRRLRGQQGSDAVMPPAWPEGALVVVLDGRLAQMDLPRDALGLARLPHRPGFPQHRRCQPARFQPDRGAAWACGPTARASARAGAGRRRPDVALGWIRRTRSKGRPPGASPRGAAMRKPMSATCPARAPGRARYCASKPSPRRAFVYTAAMQAADGAGRGLCGRGRAALGHRDGPGPAARVEVVL